MTTLPNSPAVLEGGLVLIDPTTAAVRRDLGFSHPGATTGEVAGPSETDVQLAAQNGLAALHKANPAVAWAGLVHGQLTPPRGLACHLGASTAEVTRIYAFVLMLPDEFRADPLSRATVLRHPTTGRG